MPKILPVGQRFNRKTKKYEDISIIAPKFEFTFPEGFCIVIDTREKDGLFQKLPKGLSVVRDTLKYGDYSIRGFEDQVSIERKTLSDLWTSLTSESARFKRELEVLATYERKWILIEALESSFLAFQPERKIHPNSIRGALVSIEIRLGIPVWQCESRVDAERWLLDRLIKFYKWKRGL